MRATHLTANLLTEPLGLTDPSPRLGWTLADGHAGARQTAYRITVGSRPEPGLADLWDSSRVESDATRDVEVPAIPLGFGERAYWQVEVWDERGQTSTSDLTFWEAGDDGAFFGAKWVKGYLVGAKRTSVPPPIFRKSFRLEAAPEFARAVFTFRGVGKVFVNGQELGDLELNPGWTDYPTRLRVTTLDAARLLKAGENEVVIEMGDGWYAGCVEWRGRQHYGDRPMALLALVIGAGDGSVVVKTDESWEVGTGATLQADLLQGTHLDPRRSADDWRPVLTEPLGDQAFHGWTHEPIRVTETIIAQSVKVFPQWPNALYVFDLGQNMVGRVRLKLKGPAGRDVRLRFAEVTKPDGTIYTENLRSAGQTDYVTLTGDPEGEWVEPAHTFHGFRYLEVFNAGEQPALEEVQGKVLHSDYRWTGQFECSEPLLNQLWKNIGWGWRGNSVDIPTDCPQRDERLGWTGDAQVFVRTATYLADTQAFWREYVQTLADAQGPHGEIPPVAPNTGVVGGDGGPAWADAFLIVPWTLYRVYGDREVLARHNEAFGRFLGFWRETAREGIRCYQDYNGFHGFGDWLSIEAHTPPEVIGTAFYAHAANLLAQIAEVLERPEDAQRFAEEFESVKAAFNRRFVTAEGLVGTGSQTGYVLALHFGLLPEELRPKATQELVNDIKRRGTKLTTGFVGSPYLNHVLTANGRADVAFDLLMQKQWPSWLYAVTQGATTIWERWDGWTHDRGFQDAGMNSFNHYAYGAIGDWLMNTVAGIETETPGFRRIRFQPHVGAGLTYVRASYDSAAGRIESSWRVADGTFSLEVVVPPNATAIIVPPPGCADCTPVEVGSGRHTLQRTMAQP